MALVSPGVQVTVTDESFFVPAQAATVPLIFVATADEKTQSDGETPAAGTYEHDVVRTVTSLNQSLELYGVPDFRQDSSGNQLHGDARNEYGLLALNQFLGIGNLAYVVRANVNLDDDIDSIRDLWDSKMADASLVLENLIIDYITEYNELNGYVPSNPNYKITVTSDEYISLVRQATEEVFESFSFSDSEENFFDDNLDPNAATSGYQLVNYNGSIFQAQQIIDFGGNLNRASVTIEMGDAISGTSLASVGSGSATYGFRIKVDGEAGYHNISVTVSDGITTYQDIINDIDTQLQGLAISAQCRLLPVTSATAGNIQIISDDVTSDSDIVILATTSNGDIPLFDNIVGLTSFEDVTNAVSGEATPTGIPQTSTAYAFGLDVDGTPEGASIQGQNMPTIGDMFTQIEAQVSGITMSVTPQGNILVKSDLVSATLSDIDINAATTLITTGLVFAGIDIGSPLEVTTVGGTNPTWLDSSETYTASITVDGLSASISIDGAAAGDFATLISEINVDLGLNAAVVLGDGTTGWFGDGTSDLTGATGIVVPTGQLAVISASTGSASTVVINDIEIFPSTDGFVSFLASVTGIAGDSELAVYGNGYDLPATGDYLGLEGLVSEWVTNALGSVVAGEFSAEEAAAMLIAAADDYKFTVEYLNETSLGANDAARRVAITTALQATINSNTEVRSENYEFNLILAPGYDEVVDELIALSVDISEEAFVIADTPVNQNPDQVAQWALTTERFSNAGVAYYYPWALMSNVDGVNVVGAPSGIALRTYAYNDNVSELWFAPAGTRRGLVSGVSQLGYVSGTLGTATTFVPANLNQGQRDNLYKDGTNINPISFYPGRGFVVWGQKTSSPDLSARNRVNVERLVRFVKRQLRKSLMSFVFEPNDTLTRDNVKAVVDNFLGDLVVRRGLYDFATICDESNNTAVRIDRNELYVDVALKPVKAAEFIFVPIRIVATDAEI